MTCRWRYGSLFPKEIAALIAGLGGRQRIALTVQALKRLDASTLCELLAADALPNLHGLSTPGCRPA